MPSESSCGDRPAFIAHINSKVCALHIHVFVLQYIFTHNDNMLSSDYYHTLFEFGER